MGSKGGGTRMDFISAEYETSIERNMACRAGRRSVQLGLGGQVCDEK